MIKRALSYDVLEPRQLLSGLTPGQIQKFYGLNHFFNANPASRGAGISIAVVVAYDNPAADYDVTRYFDAPYHLPGLSMTTFNLGAAGNQPLVAWSTEAETDIEMVHTIAPLAHIDLVEAIDDNLQDLMQADQYAASLPGVAVVSDSWGVPEFATEDQFDGDLTAPGVTFIAATGDVGSPEYPSVSPAAVAVGGAWVAGNGAVPWVNSGAGASQYYPERQVPDVRMAVNSTMLTGTSVSAPLFAGLVGIADAIREQQGLPALSSSDVTSRIDSVYGTDQYNVDFKVIASGHQARDGRRATTEPGSPRAPGLINLLSATASAAVRESKIFTLAKSPRLPHR